MGSSGTGSGRNIEPTTTDNGQPAPVRAWCVRGRLPIIHRCQDRPRDGHGGCGPLLRLIPMFLTGLSIWSVHVLAFCLKKFNKSKIKKWSVHVSVLMENREDAMSLIAHLIMFVENLQRKEMGSICWKKWMPSSIGYTEMGVISKKMGASRV